MPYVNIHQSRTTTRVTNNAHRHVWVGFIYLCFVESIYTCLFSYIQVYLWHTYVWVFLYLSLSIHTNLSMTCVCMGLFTYVSFHITKSICGIHMYGSLFICILSSFQVYLRHTYVWVSLHMSLSIYPSLSMTYIRMIFLYMSLSIFPSLSMTYICMVSLHMSLFVNPSLSMTHICMVSLYMSLSIFPNLSMTCVCMCLFTYVTFHISKSICDMNMYASLYKCHFSSHKYKSICEICVAPVSAERSVSDSSCNLPMMSLSEFEGAPAICTWVTN